MEFNLIITTILCRISHSCVWVTRWKKEC